MNSDCNKISEVLRRGGTDQVQRDNNFLDPTGIQLHGFSIKDWMAFAFNFAKHVNYFASDEPDTPSGNWQNFFLDKPEREDLAKLLDTVDNDDTSDLFKTLDEEDQLTPHMALFICFLKLLENTTERFNGITKRHLDYYYEEVLQIAKLPAEYDKVYIIFQLSKNAQMEELGTDVELNGGKDANGKQLTYKLSETLAANRASIGDLKNFYFAPDEINASSGNPKSINYMKAAPVPNSTDGLGNPLPEDQQFWYPFGYKHNDPTIVPAFKRLPNAKIGFTLAAPILKLSEGDRHIQITLEFNSLPGTATDQQIKNALLSEAILVQYTSEKKWINLGQLTSNYSDPLQVNYQTGKVANSNKINLYFEIDSGKEPVTAYNQEIHGGNYETSAPMLKFEINVNTPKGLTIYEHLTNKINKIDINVNVIGMKNVRLENDHGNLNPAKPMYPFTTIPVSGSSFTASHDEIFDKNWQSINLDLDWKNVPENLREWYEAYKKEFQKPKFSKDSYFSVLQSPTAFHEFWQTPQDQGIVPNPWHFTADTFIEYDGKWEDYSSSSKLFDYFSTSIGNKSYYTTKVGRTFGFNNIETTKKASGVRITLNETFLHEMYPRLYAVSMTSEAATPMSITIDGTEATVTQQTTDDIPIPNEPYTPFIENVTLSYTASSTTKLDFGVSPGKNEIEEAFETREIELIHEHPFGTAETHPQIQNLTPTCTLVPHYNRGGQLYIGLENAAHLQNVSLLIQLMEGTENPLTSTFQNGEAVTWDILGNNEWHQLDSLLMTQNEIDNFLKSGIVKFQIPRTASNDNTLLPQGYFWVRATMPKEFSAVCRIQNVHTQAVLAEFSNNDNDVSHLDQGIEAGTIKKLIKRSARVKGLSQPYNSFGGKSEETDEAYYRRVSERLRHKKRAVNLWDYEHLLLQKFTDIYKVKCLNHTCSSSFTAAGSVTLVVIPDIVNKNVYNIYEPRVSTAYLNEIEAFMKQFTSLHVCLNVINPEYEAVKVSVHVRFNEGLDFTLHSEKLKSAITTLLSPWASDDSKKIEFGSTLHKSVLINFIEQLEYVDYIEQISISVDNGAAVDSYTPKSPKSIMVSAKTHDVFQAESSCPTQNTPTLEC